MFDWFACMRALVVLGTNFGECRADQCVYVYASVTKRVSCLSVDSEGDRQQVPVAVINHLQIKTQNQDIIHAT